MKFFLSLLFCILCLDAQEFTTMDDLDNNLNKYPQIIALGTQGGGAMDLDFEEFDKNLDSFEDPQNVTTKQSIEQRILLLKEEIQKNGEVPVSLKKMQEKKAKIPSKNGLFVGIMFGYGRIANSYEDGKYNRANQVEGAENTSILKNFTSISDLALFGGKIGYQNFFNSYFGTRIYGDVLLGSGGVYLKKLNTKREAIGENLYGLGALNLDFLAEMPVSKNIELGSFLGFGFGAMILSDKAKNISLLARDTTMQWQSKNLLWKRLLQVDYMINFGINLTLYKKHRIEIATKIPISQLLLGIESPATYFNAKQGNSNQIEKKEKALMSGDISFWRSSFFIISYNYLF